MTKPAFYIYSYPRSGSHYLNELLRSRFDCHTVLRHSLEDYGSEHLISIIRNPFDCILSDVSKFVENEVNYFQEYFDPYINTVANIYVETLSSISTKAEIIIDFNDLVNDPNKVAYKIADILGLEVFNTDQPVPIRDYPEAGFLASSKNLSSYSHIKDRLSKVDYLADARDAYTMVLDKVI